RAPLSNHQLPNPPVFTTGRTRYVALSPEEGKMNRVLLLLVGAGLSSLAVRAQGNTVNGNVGPMERAGSPALECRILDSQRQVVTEVIESFNSINAYWLSFRNNTSQTPSQVTFRVAFSADSPLTLQSQIFIPGDDSGIDTPFGVPF